MDEVLRYIPVLGRIKLPRVGTFDGAGLESVTQLQQHTYNQKNANFDCDFLYVNFLPKRPGPNIIEHIHNNPNKTYFIRSNLGPTKIRGNKHKSHKIIIPQLVTTCTCIRSYLYVQPKSNRSRYRKYLITSSTFFRYQ